MPPRRPEHQPHTYLRRRPLRLAAPEAAPSPRESLTLRFEGGAMRVVGHEPRPPRVQNVPTPHARRAAEKPALASGDPRWVLATRAVQMVRGGGVMPAASRAELIRIGKIMGLSPFQANLIIAIVQDQARRGESVGSAADLIAMIGLEHGADAPRWRVAAWCSLVLLAEAAAVILLMN